MDCMPLCPTTCTNMDVDSPCTSVCARGCGCPDRIVISEEQGRCVMPSIYPNNGISNSRQLIVVTLVSTPNFAVPYIAHYSQ